MRWLPNIRYGTDGYPERIARRLRAFNIAVWVAAIIPGTMALVRLVQGKWQVAAIDVLVAASYASMPLLHRFGPLFAPLAFTAISYGVIFWVNWLVGTGGGQSLGYFVATALGILIVGTEHYGIALAVAALSMVMVIGEEVILPRDTGFVSKNVLFLTNFAGTVVFNAAILYGIIFYAVKQMERAEAAAEREQQRSEALLVNILPATVAQRLKDSPATIVADTYEEASVLFADMAGFTARAADTPPQELVQFLNTVFSNIDALVDKHGLEKIKTSGDAYIVVSGAPVRRSDHAAALASLALEMRDTLQGLVDPKGREVPVRIGIACGPVVAGVIGMRKFFYDVWGDAVNMASRMESTGVAGKIQVSCEAYEKLRPDFELESRGGIEIKGKGELPTWFLVGRRSGADAPAAVARQAL